VDQQLEWPDVDTFKDWLREESVVRLRIAGPWIRDGIKLENKVRLSLYKWWLKAVEEGVGKPIMSEDDLEAKWDQLDAQRRWRQQQQLAQRKIQQKAAPRSRRSRDKRREMRTSNYEDIWEDDFSWVSDTSLGLDDDYDDELADLYYNNEEDLDGAWDWETAAPSSRGMSRRYGNKSPTSSSRQGRRAPPRDRPDRVRDEWGDWDDDNRMW